MSASDGIALLAIVVALGTAVVGWKWAQRADGRTADANTLAAEALALAQSAEERAQRLEDQAIEPRDVQWEHIEDPSNDAALAFRHVGSDNAHEVTLIVDPRNEPWPRRTSPPGVFIAMVGALHVRARITWRSPSGVPGSQDFDDLTL